MKEEFEVGQWVEYSDPRDGKGRKGRVKKCKGDWVFVVFYADDNWDDFQSYPATLCHPKRLSTI